MQEKFNHFRMTLLFILGIMVILQISSCDNQKERKTLNQYVVNVKKNTSLKKTPPLSTLQAPISYKYESFARRIPFKVKEKPIENRDSTSNPLHVYPLSMLKFKGTITECNKSFAYILAPDKKLYVVKTGDRLGDQQGRIAHIYQDKIIVFEQGDKAQEKVKRIIKLQIEDIQG